MILFAGFVYRQNWVPLYYTSLGSFVYTGTYAIRAKKARIFGGCGAWAGLFGQSFAGKMPHGDLECCARGDIIPLTYLARLVGLTSPMRS